MTQSKQILAKSLRTLKLSDLDVRHMPAVVSVWNEWLCYT